MNNQNLDDIYLKSSLALQVLNTKFNSFYQEQTKLKEQNPIEHIKARLKSEKSIKNKLTNRLKLDYTKENIETHLYDIAGIRIICPFLRDIDKVISFINQDPDIQIIEVKDYITNPKPNGYSSYHLRVLVPVAIYNQTELVKAEIQIRTLAIDAIASLEHKIIYKNNTKLPDETKLNLQKITRYVNSLDKYLNDFITKKPIIPPTHNLTTWQNSLFETIFKQTVNKYSKALTKTEKLITDLTRDNFPDTSPVDHLKSRIKPVDSIIQKLSAKNLPLALTNVEQYINDIAGIQIVCSFLNDVEKVITTLTNSPDLVILEVQDYIQNPKPSGYASYHLLVGIPVLIDGKQTLTKVEIQVRTVIMDFWANIEHILCYKKTPSPETKLLMQRLATDLSLIDNNLNDLFIKSNETKNTYPVTSPKKLTKSN